MLPSLPEYYQGLTVPIIIAIVLAAILTATTFTLFAINLLNLIKFVPKEFKTNTIFLCSIYQVVAVSHFIQILIPRSVALVETVSILTFGFGALIFHSLLLQYVGGESNLIKESQLDAFKLRVPPMCLLPFVKPAAVTKKKLLAVRIMIMQFPIIHGLIYVFYNIRMIEDPTGNTVYFIPIMLASIVPVVWGLNIFIRLIAPVVPDHNIKAKYVTLQLILLVCKLQPAIGDLLYGNIQALQELKARYPMTVEVYKNVIISTIILIQLVILSIFSYRAYAMPKRLTPTEASEAIVTVIEGTQQEMTS